MHLPRVPVHQFDHGRSEERRIDGVEVAARTLEELEEQTPMVGRPGAHRPRCDRREARVVAGDLEHRMATVEDRVVGPPDGHQIARLPGVRRRQRRGGTAPHDTAEVEAQVMEFVECRLERPRDDLERAGGARGRCDEEREPVRWDARVGGEADADVRRGQRPRLEQPDRHGWPLPMADHVEERLAADGRANRSARHREVAVARDLPAGVLRREARGDGGFARDLHDPIWAVGPGRRERRAADAADRDGTAAGHRDPCHREARRVAPGSPHAAIDDPGGRDPADGHARGRRGGTELVGQPERGGIEGHGTRSGDDDIMRLPGPLGNDLRRNGAAVDVSRFVPEPPAMPSLTVENYVKTICQITSGQDGRPATTGQIAAALGVAPGTVTSMLKTLDAARLATHRPYEGVALTRAGRVLALRMIRRHRLIELFLIRTLGMSWDEVHDEAEHLEHAVSDLLIDRIDEFLDHPDVDPHGDPIPRGDAQSLADAHTLADTEAAPRSLAECGAGVQFRLARVLDQSPAFLRYLTDSGLELNATGAVERNPDGAGLMRIRVGERRLSLALDAAASLLVVDL